MTTYQLHTPPTSSKMISANFEKQKELKVRMNPFAMAFMDVFL